MTVVRDKRRRKVTRVVTGNFSTPQPGGVDQQRFFSDCIHLGEKVGEQMCAGCPSKRKLIPVFACAKFGKAAGRRVLVDARKPDPDVAVCVGCQEFAPK